MNTYRTNVNGEVRAVESAAPLPTGNCIRCGERDIVLCSCCSLCLSCHSATRNAALKLSDPVAVDLMLKFNEASAEQAPLDEWSAERYREEAS